MMKKFIISIISISFIIEAYSEIKIPTYFTSNMVLQQNEEILIFGRANPFEKITGNFKEELKTSITDKNGNWEIRFKKSSFGGPYNLTLKGENTIILSNIYIGDVWFCSGQSNMGWKLEKSEGGLQAIKTANYPEIKILNLSRTMSSTVKQVIQRKNKWKTCTSKNIKGFSAVAFFFGRELYEKNKVPIGLIHASWGGSSIESWMEENLFKNHPIEKEVIAKMKKRDLDSLSKVYKINEKEYSKYLNTKDIGLIEKWFLTNTNYSNWNTFELPKRWAKTNLKKRYGIVWVTKTIKLNENDLNNNLLLSLGRIDNEDITYINGYLVGQIKSNSTDRLYTIDKRYLKKGSNRITIRVKNPLDIGGFRSEKSKLYLKTDSRTISLANTWKYKVGTPDIKSPPKRVHPKYYPTSLFNAMVHPFLKLKIKGVIWYQGESNMSKPEKYAEDFPKMITSWRNHWKSKFPFLFVQLPNLANKDGRMPKIRQAQTKALTLDNVGMVTSIDIGDDYNIHPSNKLDVGKRLAFLANRINIKNGLKNFYPHIVKIKTLKNSIRIKFNKPFSVKGDSENIYGFELDDFSDITVKKINRKNIEIHFAQTYKSKELKYLWNDAPKKVMLYNEHNFPIPPFKINLEK